MTRGVTKAELESEWRSLPMNWYSIYQWRPTSRDGYLEWIAEWIVSSFPLIQLNANSLRTRSFRVAEHRGQIVLRTGIEQLTEKRIVRAMFNLSQLPLLGKVIDYEVPLKETDEADHGDIDLLCVTPNACLCVEAKKPDSSESILKSRLAGIRLHVTGFHKEAGVSGRFLPRFELTIDPRNTHVCSGEIGAAVGNNELLPSIDGIDSDFERTTRS